MPKAVKQTSAKDKKPSLWERWRTRVRDFLARRPHRSFRRTLRRDLPKPPRLPGYFSFSRYAIATALKYKKGFGILLALYVLVSMVLIGLADQSRYSALTESFDTLAPDLLGGEFDTVTQTGALFATAIMGGLNDPLSDVQQIYVLLIGLFAWLVVVWYLRYRMSGEVVKVRDALYNAGAPAIATILVFGLLMLQFLPGAVAVIAYSSAYTAGALTGGVEAMMFAVAAGLLVVLSLYWATSTFFAILIVTIPGTYPMRAIRMAGDIVLGRRLSVMLRLLWLALLLILVWAVILIPVILVANWAPIDWLPLVPLTLQVLTGVSVLFSAIYIYLLYRKMIDEPAAS